MYLEVPNIIFRTEKVPNVGNEMLNTEAGHEREASVAVFPTASVAVFPAAFVLTEKCRAAIPSTGANEIFPRAKYQG